MVIIFLLCLLAGILLVVVAIRNDWDLVLPCGCGLVISGTFVVFFLWPLIYCDSYVQLVKMEAFYDANRSAYESTIETTRDAIYKISKDSNLRIDVENLQQSTNWSKRLAEFRDAVIEYNTCIYKLRRYNQTFVLSAMFPNPRDNLKLIILQE